MDVTIGMRLALAAAHTRDDKRRKARSRLRAIMEETEIAPWLDRSELAFRVVSRADAEGIAGSEDLDDDDLGIMAVASREAEMKAEALRALVQDAAGRLTPEERAALRRFLYDPSGAEAFEAAKFLLDEIEVVEPEPPFPGLRDEA